MIDETHAADRTSWVASANGHPTFLIQNLPLGVFSPPGGSARGGLAIGDSIFDIGAALEADLFSGAAGDAAEAASGRTLNPLLEAGPPARQALRRRVGEILDANGSDAGKIQTIAGRLVHDADRCALHGDPAPLPDQNDAMDQAQGCFAIDVQVLLLTPRMRSDSAAPHVLSRSNAAMLYWTAAQMVAHHTTNGCNLQPGDLFGSGTVSGTEPASEGCLLEMTRGGRQPVTLPNGETRTYLADGDEVIFRGTARRHGYAFIRFGECRGTVTEALPPR